MKLIKDSLTDVVNLKGYHLVIRNWSVGFCRGSRVEGKMSRVEGKMSRVECKMSRVESKMSRVQKCR